MNATPYLGWAATLVGAAAAVSGTCWLMHAGRELRHPAVLERCERDGRDLAFLRAPFGARALLVAQAAGTVASLCTGLLLQSWFPLVVAGLIPWLPQRVLAGRVHRRRRSAEAQAPAFLRALAAALHGRPSLAEGLRATQPLVPGVVAVEIDTALRTHALGLPLARALAEMSERIASPLVAGAILSMRLSERTGGDLPRTLRTTAAALEELIRLDGVLRAQTAQGRAQATVIGVLPIPLVLLVEQVDPGFLMPLWETTAGQALAAACVALWAAAIVVARRILSVQF